MRIKVKPNESCVLDIAEWIGVRARTNEHLVCEKEAVWNYSQHYFAELRGEEVIEDIRRLVSGRRAKSILDAQILDEKNHAKIYRRVCDRIGLASEAAGYSQAYSQFIFNLKTLPEKVFAFQILTESTAHAYLSWRLSAVEDEELIQLDRSVLADEVRHLVMGSVLLRICEPDEIAAHLPPNIRTKLIREVLNFGLTSFRDSIEFCLPEVDIPLRLKKPTKLERLITRTVVTEARRQTALLDSKVSSDD